MKQGPGRYGILNASSCRWEYDLEELSEAQVRTIFSKGLPGSYSVSEDRLIQRYIEAWGYNVVVFVAAWLNPGTPVPSGRFFYLTRGDNEHEVADRVRRYQRGQVPLMAHGYITVHIADIHHYVRGTFDLMKKASDEWLTLREVTGEVWPSFSTSNRVTWLQNWITGRKHKEENPVLVPVRPARGQGDRIGNRLGLADTVLVGLVHGLLRHDVKLSDLVARGQVHRENH